MYIQEIHFVYRASTTHKSTLKRECPAVGAEFYVEFYGALTAPSLKRVNVFLKMYFLKCISQNVEFYGALTAQSLKKGVGFQFKRFEDTQKHSKEKSNKNAKMPALQVRVLQQNLFFKRL